MFSKLNPLKKTDKGSSTHTGFDPYEVLEVRHLTADSFSLRIERRDLVFKAGQCFNVGPMGAIVNREYSIYSGESEPYLEFLIKLVKDGAVSSKLHSLKKGDLVEVAGPYGLFTLNQKNISQNKYVFIATGTGIAPFHSYVKSNPGLNYQIIHGVREARDQHDKATYEPARYTACVSREKGEWFNGRVTEYLKDRALDKDAYYYICGNRKMISEVFDLLTSKQISGDRIITEVFF